MSQLEAEIAGLIKNKYLAHLILLILVGTIIGLILIPGNNPKLIRSALLSDIQSHFQVSLVASLSLSFWFINHTKFSTFQILTFLLVLFSLLEAAQFMVAGRDPELEDWFANLSGCTLAFVSAAWFRKTVSERACSAFSMAFNLAALVCLLSYLIFFSEIFYESNKGKALTQNCGEITATRIEIKEFTFPTICNENSKPGDQFYEFGGGFISEANSINSESSFTVANLSLIHI